jgi:RHS repeat-associated protein
MHLSEVDLDAEYPVLILATGERFAIDMSASDIMGTAAWKLKDQKLEVVRLSRQVDGTLRLDHRHGDSEILCQHGDSPRYVLSEVHSPLGDKLFIDWLPATDGPPQLASIRDGQRTLLALRRSEGLISMELNPGTSQASQVELLLSNDKLTQITLPGAATPMHIDYDHVILQSGHTLLLPSECTSPLGARDTLHWAEGREGHLMPAGSPLASLPRVVGWTHSTGIPGNDRHHQYDWLGDHNFLGYASEQPHAWKDGQDNLYLASSDYRYQVTETISDGQGQEQARITRTWNRFHLLESQCQRQGACEVRERTVYGESPDLAWAEQPAHCQLPVEAVTTYVNHSQPSTERSERTVFRYDPQGNLLQVEHPSGLQVHHTYHPAGGNADCPADPLGWVRHLASTSVHPVPTEADAPLLCDRFRYQAIPSSIAGAPAHVVLLTQESRDDSADTVLKMSELTYELIPGAFYGNLTRQVITLGGKSTRNEHSYYIDGDSLVSETTVVGFENDELNRAKSSIGHCLTTGLIAWERSANGASTQFTHDQVGRLTHTVMAAGSPHEQQRLVRYHLNDAIALEHAPSGTGLRNMIEQVDVTGRRQRQWLDGDGRTVRVQLEDLDDNSDVFRDITQYEFDVQGRLVSETALDWLGEDTTPLRLTSTCQYDGWGNLCLRTSPEGIEHYTRHDVVGRRSEHWQAAGSVLGPRQVSLFDSAGGLVERQWYDAGGQLLRTLRLERDGLGRVAKQHVLLGTLPHSTLSQRYDGFSRLTEQQLADGTTLNWRYAPHSDGYHPEAVTLRASSSALTLSAPITLGSQVFDGLGRQRSVTVGNHTTLYQYQSGQLPTSANVLADGKRVAYTYNPALDNALLSVEADGEAHQKLAYHPTLATPMQAEGAQGQQRWQFSKAGLVQSDTWEVNGEAASSQWCYSLKGLPLSLIDAAGVRHERGYDAFGRLSVVTVGNVRTVLTYDPLARLASQVTTDLGSGHQLVKEVAYDGMGREHQVRFVSSQGDARHTYVQTLLYNGLDQLVSRTWQSGQTEGLEHFEYDLRGRLVRYTANADAAPPDPYGNLITEQQFTFNALDGHQQVTSTFIDGSQDIASYTYAPQDPTRVVSISHTHSSWPATIELTYDACGRLSSDSLGRRLVWDSHGRLIRAERGEDVCLYRYNASGQLCERELNGTSTRGFHAGAQLTHERCGERSMSLVGDGQMLFATAPLDVPPGNATLLASDAQGSIRLLAGDEQNVRSYSPHGSSQSAQAQVPFGFTGNRCEQPFGWYIVAGYRPYDPLLMMFLSPDSESPFGVGGINPYVYCAGDPVNRIDPDGHNWVAWTVAALGLAAGALATLASAGSAAPALWGVISAGLGTLTTSGMIAIGSASLSVMSLGTSIASMALQSSSCDPRAADMLGWISLGSGLASSALTLAPQAGRLLHRLVSTPLRTSSASPSPSPVKFVRGYADVLYSEGLENDVAFHRNVWGQGYTAFETHGSPGGKLMNAQGRMENARQVALREIAPRHQQLGTPNGQPMVLLACEGGRSGAAQQLADVLRRPVYGYDNVIYVMRASFMKSVDTGAAFNIPLQRTPWWRRLAGTQSPSARMPGFEIASGRTYYPH